MKLNTHVFKNLNLITYFSLVFVLLLLPFLTTNIKKKIISGNNKNNLEKQIIDSIDPLCENMDFSENKNRIINLEEIFIEIPDSRDWFLNLVSAANSRALSISDNYKKKYRGFVLINGQNKLTCKFPAKIRLSGDGKDHIEINGSDIKASMDVELVEGNLDGIVKFKLFLTKTKRGDSEVIATNILRSLGYVAPRTKIINVEVNGIKSRMIMQEKASKELLESNKIRETAIIGINETVLWKLRAHDGRTFNAIIFPKILNFKWARKGEVNKLITLKGMQILGRSISESWNRRDESLENSFSDYLLSNNNFNNEKKLAKFRVHMISMDAKHGLANHNRKFYFDALNNSLLPIYYDGMPFESEFYLSKNINIDSFKRAQILKEIEIEDINFAIQDLKNLDIKDLSKRINKSGVELDQDILSKIIKRMIDNQVYLKKFINKDSSLTWGLSPLRRYKSNFVKYGLAFSDDGEVYYLCDIDKNKCENKKLNFNESINLLRGRYKENKKIFYYLGKSFIESKDGYSDDLKDEKIYQFDGVYIRYFGEPSIKIDNKNKIININVSSKQDKIVILNSFLKDWEINVDAKNSEIRNQINISRFDENLLTGLLTIKDSVLKNISIKINGGFQEDSLNIINTKGLIDIISVSNSFQDAIDFDFSDIKVEKILVKNAGNDCLDLSSGSYFISYLRSNNCADKGISVGESSKVIINNVYQSGSNISLVSKDSSNLIVNNADLLNYKNCAAVYRKKQEFGAASLTIPKYACPKNKLLIQNNSEIILK